MPGIRVEDNSVEGMYDAAGEAIARARAGDGPSLIEVHTLRLWGHFEGDAQGYRTDLGGVPDRDPLPAYRATLTAKGALTDADYAAMEASASEIVEDAIDFAKASPTPDPATALEYVFAEGARS